MSCLTSRLEGEPCIKCGRADQVYLGHGEVRFCAYCTLSWDQHEFQTVEFLLKQKNVVLTDDAVDGELPSDMVERIGLLAGFLKTVFAFERRLTDMMAIPEALFTEEEIKKSLVGRQEEAEYDQKKAALWRQMVAEFSRVMSLVHLSMRMVSVDVDQLRDELVKARTLEFEDAVSDYTAQMQCGGTGHLRPGAELDRIRKKSRLDAEQIADTYNRDLALVIAQIREESPRANRHTYAKRLRVWDQGRSSWKTTQISLHTIMTTRDMALKSFSQHNGLEPSVMLFPRLAKEPICQGWINRGLVSFEVAKRNPSPYHVGCVHFWRPEFEKGDCTNLWQG